MLSSFRARNFRSIVDLRVDFGFAEGKAPKGYRDASRVPFVEAGSVRGVPCLALFGPNASGKTNILSAVRNCIALVCLGIKAGKLANPNVFLFEKDTSFAVEFIRGKRKYLYEISYSVDGISFERLSVDGTLVFALGQDTEVNVDSIAETFEIYDKTKLNDIVQVECKDGNGVQNLPLLHVLGQRYSGLNEDVRAAYDFFAHDLRVFMRGDSNRTLPDVVKALAHARKQSEEQALMDIVEIVRRLDVDIDGVQIFNERPKFDVEIGFPLTRNFVGAENPETKIVEPRYIAALHHGADNRPIMLDFMNDESEGTKALATVAGILLTAVALGQTVFFDELDASLHPLITIELIKLFTEKRWNETGAQLIFTTHATELLDDATLRVSEVGIVRKTRPNGTVLTRLSDFRAHGEDIRSVTNFRKRYIAGQYYGIPSPSL